MTVMIKDVDFPDGCYNCKLRDGNGCFVEKAIILIKRGEVRPDWCPLGEVSIIKSPMTDKELEDCNFEL